MQTPPACKSFQVGTERPEVPLDAQSFRAQADALGRAPLAKLRGVWVLLG